MKDSDIKLGRLYTSKIDKTLYDSMNIWTGKDIGQVDKNIPFVLLGFSPWENFSSYYQTSFLKILSNDGKIGFIRIFVSFGETIEEAKP